LADLQHVKTAQGRRLRHPQTGKVMTNVAVPDAAPHKVDLHDPHWYKALKRRDIVVVDAPKPPAAPPPAPAPAATATVATNSASSSSASSTNSAAKPAPAAAPGTSVES